MREQWEVVTDPADIRPEDHIRATGYDDAELRTLTAAELVRLVNLGAVRRRVPRA